MIADSVPSQSPGLTDSQTKGFPWEVAQPAQAALNQWDQVSRQIPDFPVPWQDNSEAYSGGPQHDWAPVGLSGSQLISTPWIGFPPFPR